MLEKWMSPRLGLLFKLTVVVFIFKGDDGVSGAAIVKPGCPPKCGDVEIPYPFGIGEGCYRDKWFEITCNHTSNLTFPVLHAYPLKVLHISPSQLRVAYKWEFPDCQPRISGISQQIYPTNMENGMFNPFIFSHTRNKLVGIGCDVFFFISNSNTYHTNYTTSGCASLCHEYNSSSFRSMAFPSNTCSGIACCQTSLPAGLKSFKVRILSVNPGNVTSTPWLPLTCSRAFLAEQSFPLDNFSNQEVPVKLTWVIGEHSCKEVLKLESYACGINTECINSGHGQGYRCRCSDGYRGNPYLTDGCQDIDECKESGSWLCGDGAVCNNTAGGYHCSCPPGYHGDATVGHRCILDKPVLSVALVVSLGVAVGIALALVIILCVLCTWRIGTHRELKRKQEFFKRNGGFLLEKINEQEGIVGKIKIYVSEELERATDNFNESRIRGKGGFGTVYKGMLSDGRIVAIKKSRLMNENQVAQFINEVVILLQINHRNIVKLLGCCLETEVPLLVYEFVCNGTLSNHLHDVGRMSSLSWEDRLRIAIEIAGALAYLHSAASTSIFHRDVKSSNILLDKNYRAKISDFGLSRSIPVDRSHLTTKVQGTFGYLDPEYFYSSQFTEKSDVYSFGVVLAELLTGEKAVSCTKSEEDKSLVMNFISAMKENRIYEILESRVLFEAEDEELLNFAKLARRCLKLNGKKRPTMREVAMELEKMRKF